MEILPALEHIHIYTESVAEPGCDRPGYTTYSCLCGDSYTDDYVAATGHSPVTLPATAATCTATGLTEGSCCTVCGNVLAEQKEVPVLPHTWDEGEKKGKEILHTCEICGAEKTEEAPARAFPWLLVAVGGGVLICLVGIAICVVLIIKNREYEE